MRARVRVRDPARHLARMLCRRAHEAEDRHRGRDVAIRIGHAIARLLHQLRKIDRPAVDARRRARLEPALRQLQLLQARRQSLRRRIARSAGAVVLQAHVDLAVQERAGRQHDGAPAERDARLRDRAGHAVGAVHRLDHQVVHGLLEQPQVGLILQPMPNRGLVENAICLRARGAHRRPLGPVEDAELNPRFVRRSRHRPAQRIDLLHQMALADPADRRVAAHLPQRLDVVCQQQRRAAHARRGQCGLGAGMAAADHDDVEFLGVDHRQLTAHDPSHRGRIEEDDPRCDAPGDSTAIAPHGDGSGEAPILGGLAPTRHPRGQSAHARRPALVLQRRHMPPGLRRLLHRAVHHQPDSRHARRQAGGCSVRATGRRHALPHLRTAGATGLLRWAAAVAGDVWGEQLARDAVAEPAGSGNATWLTPALSLEASTRTRNLRRVPLLLIRC